MLSPTTIVTHFTDKCMSSYGNIFRVIGPLCGEFTGEFPVQGPVMRSFDIFFDLRLKKHFRKQSWDWWFETLSRLLWRRCDVTSNNKNDCQMSRICKKQYCIHVTYMSWSTIRFQGLELHKQQNLNRIN